MTTTSLAAADQTIVADELVDAGDHRILSCTQIRISPDNRKHFNQPAMTKLAASIKEVGVMQPILVRPVTPTDEHPEPYEIVAGERRWRASVMAGRPTISCMVRELSDIEAAKLRIMENIHRENPHEMEEAEGFQLLMLNHGYTADKLAEEIKQSRSYVYGRIKLCALALEVREQFLEDRELLPASTALLLARIPVPSLQVQALAEILDPKTPPLEPMSYRRAAQFIQDRYMLDLDEADFPTDDAKLLAAAGSCATCPKRTGNQQEVFDDVKNANVCTDPNCFGEKRGAHAAQTIIVAKKKGLTIYEGEDARKLMANHWSADSEFVIRATRVNSFARVIKKGSFPIGDFLTAETLPPACGFIKNDGTKLTAVYRRVAMQTALEKVGVCETVQAYTKRLSEEAKSKEQAATETGTAFAPADAWPFPTGGSQPAKIDTVKIRIDIETDYRVSLYKELRAHAQQQGFSHTSLREIAKLALTQFPLPDDILTDVYAFDTTSDAKICAHIDEAPLMEVQLILFDLILGEGLTVDYHAMRNGSERESAHYQAMEAIARSEGLVPEDIERGAMMRATRMEELTADQVHDFVKFNPERINELAQFVLKDRMFLVGALETAAKALGYIYRSQKDGGYTKPGAADTVQESSKAAATESADSSATAAPEATAAPAPAKVKSKVMKPAPDHNQRVPQPAQKAAAKNVTKPSTAKKTSSPTKKPAAKPTTATKKPAAKTPAAKPTKPGTKSAAKPVEGWPFPKDAAAAAEKKTTAKSSKGASK